AVGRRHVDAAFFRWAAEEFFHAKPRPLRRELRAAGEDAGDARLGKGRTALFEFEAEGFDQLRSAEHALDVVSRTEDCYGLIDAVLFVGFEVIHPALLDELDDPPGVEVDTKANPTAKLG